jgi:hypothetical protein
VPIETNCTFMSTWQSKESLSEGLWFLLHSAFAPQGYDHTCENWIVAAMENWEWEAAIGADVTVLSQPKT